jgi:Skp family chaperone for outer membrane proteins
MLLQMENQELEEVLEDNDRKDQITASKVKEYLSLSSSKPIDTLDNSILTNAVYEFHRDLVQLKSQNETKDKEIQSLNEKMVKSQQESNIQAKQKQSLEKDFLKLKNYIINKQKEIEKLSYYQTTITTQEKIIAKLQLLCESKMKGKFSFLKNDLQAQQPQLQHHPHSHHHRHHNSQKELQDLQDMMRPPSLPLLENINNNEKEENEKLRQEMNEKNQQLDTSNQEIVQLNTKVSSFFCCYFSDFFSYSIHSRWKLWRIR